MLDWNPTNPHVSGRDYMVRMIKNKNQNTDFNHFINHYNKYSIHFILKFHLTSKYQHCYHQLLLLPVHKY